MTTKPTREEIVTMLESLEELQAQIALLEIQKQDVINRNIPAEYLAELQSIEDEFSGKAETANEKINELSAMIREAVKEYGSKVEGTNLVAVFRKGSEKWDGEKLKGLALVYPEIGACHEIGAPSVAIQAKKK